jgi:hypothetical protein
LLEMLLSAFVFFSHCFFPPSLELLFLRGRGGRMRAVYCCARTASLITILLCLSVSLACHPLPRVDISAVHLVLL